MDNNNSLSVSNSGLMALLQKSNMSLDIFKREILALSCLIAGTSFTNLKEIEPQLEVNTTELKLKRESKNKFDKLAVAIMFDKQKLGYIPRDKNDVIANLMDAGKKFSAKIKTKEWEGNWLKLDVEIYLVD